MATPLTVVREDVLAPISPGRPAGEDLSVTAEWALIRGARPNAWDSGNRHEWERATATPASWSLLKERTATALATRSKDLRLAIWLLEASINVEGFTGARDGLRVIRELIMAFWDSGLYPSIEDGDLESRSGPLEWLSEKLAEALREIPLTLRPPPGDNYSLRYFYESRRADGVLTAQEFDSAAAAGSHEQYQRLLEDLDTAAVELLEVERLCRAKFPPQGISLVDAKEAFQECRRVVDRLARSKAPAAPPPPVATPAQPTVPLPQDPDAPAASPQPLPVDGAPESAWAAAEKLARSGEIDRALAQMTALANIEPNGRARFHRKLLLAEICLNTRRTRLGRAILEELAELIEKHNLEQWETSEVVSAVWTRLYRCYLEEAGNSVDERAAKLFDRLCRLNPWQALACCEGK
jgi:type VI secretion system protein ImpA